MDSEGHNAYFVDTLHHCFTCLKKVSSRHSYSFLDISQYLEINVKELNLQKTHDEQEERLGSDFKAALCPTCAGTMQEFSDFHKQLVKIKMDLTSRLQNIFEKMSKAEETSDLEKVRKSATRGNALTREKLAIAEKVRMEVIKKCSVKLKVTNPFEDLIEIYKTREGLETRDVEQSEMSPSFSPDNGEETDYPMGTSSPLPPPVAVEIEELDTPTFDNNSMESVESLPQPPSTPTIPSNKSRKVDKARRKVRIDIKNKQEKIKSEKSKSNSEIGDSLQCKYCGKQYSHHNPLRRHINFVHLNISYHCDDCNKEFTRKDYFNRHRQIIHFECNNCKKMFSSKDELRTHNLVDNCGQTPKDVHCEHCGKEFRDRNHLKRHEESVHLKIKRECEICKIQLSSDSHLRRHLQNVHGLEVPPKQRSTPVAAAVPKIRKKKRIKKDNGVSDNTGRNDTSGIKTELHAEVDNLSDENNDSFFNNETVNEQLPPPSSKIRYFCEICQNSFSKLDYLNRHKSSAHPGNN